MSADLSSAVKCDGFKAPHGYKAQERFHVWNLIGRFGGKFDTKEGFLTATVNIRKRLCICLMKTSRTFREILHCENNSVTGNVIENKCIRYLDMGE